MVKWKSINKKLFMVMLSVVMLLSSQLTAFAYTDTSAETETETAETEQVLEDNHSDDSFSVAGNGEVLDDITDDSSKEFLTITTKNNNTFYIVIDRSATTDNVYMLSQIDENDLKEFVDSNVQEETQGAAVVLEETPVKDTAEVVVEETEEEPAVTANTGGMLAILAVAAAGVAGYYFLKFRKDNQDDDDSADEGMENPGAETEEKTVDEDEESAQQAEKNKTETK